MRGIRGDHVAHPSEQAAAAYPHAWRDDEPEDAAKEVAVVELPDPWDQQAEYGCKSRMPPMCHGLVRASALYDARRSLAATARSASAMISAAGRTPAERSSSRPRCTMARVGIDWMRYRAAISVS
jgi:hypothetical protein